MERRPHLLEIGSRQVVSALQNTLTPRFLNSARRRDSLPHARSLQRGGANFQRQRLLPRIADHYPEFIIVTQKEKCGSAALKYNQSKQKHQFFIQLKKFTQLVSEQLKLVGFSDQPK
jgi:hypothetical protein